MSTYEMWLTGFFLFTLYLAVIYWWKTETLQNRLFAANEELSRLKAKKNVIQTVQSCFGGKCDCS